MLKEYKEFALKGSVVDMAVGLIVGAGFTAVIQALVNDMFMPVLGIATGEVDVSNRFLVLTHGPVDHGPYESIAAAKKAGANILTYGNFFQSLLSFTIVSFALFFLVRWVNRLKRHDTPKPVTIKACPYCQTAISLKAIRCPSCTSELTAPPNTTPP